MQNQRFKIITEIAIFAVLALILDLLDIGFGWTIEISVKLLPIILLSIRRGIGPGLVGGLLYAVLQTMVGNAWILSPIQYLLEYPIAFASVGLAGFMHRPMQRVLLTEPANKRKQTGIAVLAMLIAFVVKYINQILAGVFFWADNLPEHLNAWTNSLIINVPAFFTEGATVLIVIVILARWYEPLLLTNED